MKREPGVIRARIGNSIVVALLTVSIYYGVDNAYDKKDIQNMIGYGFLLVLGQLFFFAAASVLLFQNERPVFLREQANQLYDIKPYFASKNVLEIPLGLVAPAIILLITYWCCGFVHSATDFFKIWIVMILIGQTGIGMGSVVSSFARNPTTATMMIPLITMPNVLFGGLLANSGTLPSYISWAQWLTVIRYGNEAVMTVLLKDVNPVTDFVLQEEGFTFGYNNCVFVMLGMCIFWRFCALIALYGSVKKFQ